MVAAGLTTGGDDSVRATCDGVRDDGRDAVTSGGTVRLGYPFEVLAFWFCFFQTGSH